MKKAIVFKCNECIAKRNPHASYTAKDGTVFKAGDAIYVSVPDEYCTHTNSDMIPDEIVIAESERYIRTANCFTKWAILNAVLRNAESCGHKIELRVCEGEFEYKAGVVDTYEVHFEEEGRDQFENVISLISKADSSYGDGGFAEIAVAVAGYDTYCIWHVDRRDEYISAPHLFDLLQEKKEDSIV